ncbi:MAG: AAA family ATPase, partial [Bacilli bacterium]|nr:AAA family ATPase [Bacilli bacterium]
MFKVKRMGLLNFWLYDAEEYEFFDGKLLLRGHNGSGKSVTMQSFIPLILDGNKTPKRLDTFGGTDKHIEYYLLDETKDVSTGYLYMEFYDEEQDKYITIGIGLHARRGKPTEFYGFALKDGSRINKDFFLYKLKDGFTKSPLTKMELKTRLAPNNTFVESAKEYKKMVNNLLYGFKNIESFDEFINVILQIRSPKLSRDYKPSTLMQTLNDVLPPLSDEDLFPLSDTIESLNSTKEQINDLSNKIKLLTNFIKIYNNYNETILYGKAKQYINKKLEHESLLKSEKECAKKIAELQKSYEQIESDMKELNHRYEKAQADKKSINNSDIASITNRLVELEKLIADTKSKISKNESYLEDISTKLKALKKEYKEYEDKLYIEEKELKKAISDIEDLCSEIDFAELLTILPVLLTGEIEDFTSILDLVEKKKKELEQIKNILEQKEEYNKKIETESSKYEELKKEYD